MSDLHLIEFKEVINGQEQVRYGTLNIVIAQKITGLHDGYFLKAESDFNVSKIFFKTSNFFDRHWKHIGTLIYDTETDVITYRKFGFNEKLHEFHKDGTFGLCWDVIRELRPKDRIVIEEITERPKGKNFYSISVNKILKHQSFKHFKTQGYEKQVFVPRDEFKKEWIKAKRKRRKRK